ncbi:cytochrome P450 [Infundibulicybe gibba]|nr:cytochrome P450 [Infundibulicybe gibba]
MSRLGVVFVIRLFRAYARNKERNPKRLPLPPGPKGLPIIGNLLDTPTHKSWVEFGEWSKTHGDIMHLNILGQSIIILCSTRRTTDLLEKRSSIYSDRPRMPMLVELMKCDFLFSLLPYGAKWRRHRRLFHEHFHMNAVPNISLRSPMERDTFSLLCWNPGGLSSHIRHTFTSTIMNITYGIKVKEKDDPYVEALETALEGVTEAGVPGAFLVDFIPILKIQEEGRHWRDANYRMTEMPWEFTKSQHSQGIATNSVAASFLDGLPTIEDKRWEMEVEARNTAVIAFIAGADTTLSSIQAFFMAMALYPDVQRKAQAELDSVVGKSRLPDFTDRGSLPYVNAVIKELLQWHSVVPLGVAHASTCDDEYDGNAWFITHDPEVYDQPLQFRPERFLKDGEIDLSVRGAEAAAFGFGRRICPGRHFADNALFSLVSSVLSVFTISHAKDKHGNVIPIHAETTSGLLSYPVPFDCEIRPRSAAAEKLIRDSQELA